MFWLCGVRTKTIKIEQKKTHKITQSLCVYAYILNVLLQTRQKIAQQTENSRMLV